MPSDDYLLGMASGEAVMLSWLRTLFTAAGKNEFSREEILIILQDAAECEDLFPGCAAALELLDAFEVEV